MRSDIETMAETIYGNWDVINWHGSAPRGAFIPGESDVDFALLVPAELPVGHIEARRAVLKQLELKWSRAGVTKIDVTVVPTSEIEDPG